MIVEVAGATERFTQLYHKNLDSVYRYGLYRGVSGGNLDEFVCQTAERAWNSFGQFEESGLSSKVWFLREARIVIGDRVYTTETVEQDLDRELRIALQRLSVDHQEVLIWRYVEDISAIEVGQILGKSVEEVVETQAEALKALQSIAPKF